MNPGAKTHGIEDDPLRYSWFKYECFLMSGKRDTSTKNFVVNSMNVMESNERTNERTNKQTYEWINRQTERRKLYTPLHKCQGYKNSPSYLETMYLPDDYKLLLPLMLPILP